MHRRKKNNAAAAQVVADANQAKVDRENAAALEEKAIDNEQVQILHHLSRVHAEKKIRGGTGKSGRR